MESTINRMLTVVLPDGSRKQFDGPTTTYDVAAGIGPGLAKAAILAEVDGKLVDLSMPLPASGGIGVSVFSDGDFGQDLRFEFAGGKLRLFLRSSGGGEAALIAIPERQRKRNTKADRVREIGRLMFVLEEDRRVRHAHHHLPHLAWLCTMPFRGPHLHVVTRVGQAH